MSETIITIDLPEHKNVQVGTSSSITQTIIKTSTFTMLEESHPRKMVSLCRGITGDIIIYTWTEGEDQIFRWSVDICIEKDDKFILTKKFPDGKERRVDIKIVL